VRRVGAAALLVVAILASVSVLHACTPADRAAATEALYLSTAACCYVRGAEGATPNAIRELCAIEKAAKPIVESILRIANEREAGAP